MIRRLKDQQTVVLLDGPDGNAFVLLGMARRYAKQLGLNPEEVVAEMTLGDYKNLLLTFEKYFGQYVILETENEEYLSYFGK